MRPQLRHIKTEIIEPSNSQDESPTTLVCNQINEAWYVKLRPLAALTVVVAGIVAVVFFGSQASIERDKATIAQSEAIKQQAQAIERQTQSIDRQSAIIEGMSERKAYVSSNNKETIDTIFVVGAIILGVYAVGKLFEDNV